ncbi:MAG: O-antigen ligase family protein [Clostridiales bacterium]|nr:O-antigen ligase family protein [Clostridiales bacterium]
MKLCDLSQTRFSQSVKKFAESMFFPLTVTLVCYISWAFSLVFLGLGVMTAFFIILMVTQKNSIYSLPIFLLAFYMIPDFKESYYYTAIYLGLGIMAVIYNILIYKTKLKKGDFFYPLLAVFFSALIGGIVYTTMTYGFGEYLKDVAFVLLLALSFAGGYLFFDNTMSLDNIDYKKYISKIFLCVAILVIAQMVAYYLRVNNILLAITHKTLFIGWGNTNTVATVLMMAIPFILYLAACYRYGAFFLVFAFSAYAAIWITQSRGCIIISTPMLLFYLIYLIIKTKNANRYLIAANAIFCALCAAVLIIVFKDEFLELFGKMFLKGFDDSGRFELYDEAWELFKKHFIFGSGFFYKTDQIRSFMYMFHSTPLQIFANLGVVGIIAFAYFYYYKYKILIKGLPSAFGMAIMMSIASLELYGLIDVTLVIYYLAISTLLLLTVAQKNAQMIEIKNTREENDPNNKNN